MNTKFMRTFTLMLAIMLLKFNVEAQMRHSRTSAFKSYKGLVMAGYQGWFNTPNDGAGRGWYHYHSRGMFQDGNCKIDLWPDVSEYSKTYESPFKGTDSLPAQLFSSYDYSTTDIHFKWMKQYDIDGIFLQRFVTEISNKPGLNHNDQVIRNVMKASSSMTGRFV
jgi:glycoprotein endo-alpha-1,2-mannosidase